MHKYAQICSIYCLGSWDRKVNLYLSCTYQVKNTQQEQSFCPLCKLQEMKLGTSFLLIASLYLMLIFQNELKL